ncbi:MAG: hypothetical protein ABH830_03660 [Patescibacteria group bacterium]
MSKNQYAEGKITGCKGIDCERACCDDGEVTEWVNEYFVFHDRLKDYLESIGVKIYFKGDRVYFENCSDGKEYKFFKYTLNNNIDPRPIDCKIYPYCVDWEDIDFNKKKVKLCIWDKNCPLVKNRNITEDFRKDVENIIKRDFSLLFYGANFSVEFNDSVF